MEDLESAEAESSEVEFMGNNSTRTKLITLGFKIKEERKIDEAEIVVISDDEGKALTPQNSQQRGGYFWGWLGLGPQLDSRLDFHFFFLLLLEENEALRENSFCKVKSELIYWDQITHRNRVIKFFTFFFSWKLDEHNELYI